MIAAGPALTVRCRPGDNFALHRAIEAAGPGDVLVADYAGSIDSGPFGEIMALACRLRGIAGLVIDGSVRDSASIAALGFPVFARGLNIRGTTKRDRGEVGGPITLGGVRIERGDLVVADADAVIVLPAGDAEAALAAGDVRAAAEARMMERLRAGETTLQILGLAKGDEP
jgi:4-hydroxy-4-methyl-2-oxoglutarate aldolase